ncbi:MAG: hypothetical protein KAK04_21815, partial [Cyclobacteriaceae bacterium]|nr:hypothetical protein [Cyclobacteriaceae bacterium]
IRRRMSWYVAIMIIQKQEYFRHSNKNRFQMPTKRRWRLEFFKLIISTNHKFLKDFLSATTRKSSPIITSIKSWV